MNDTLFHPKADEISERIANAFWALHGQSGSERGVTILDVHQHNAANHTLTGKIDVDGQTYGFICEMGDWNGFIMLKWGDHEDVGYYKPPVIEPTVWVPTQETMNKWPAESEASYSYHIHTYALFRRRKDVVELLGKYLYDCHFQPSSKVERYYRERAAKWGMEPGLFSNLPKRVRDEVREWDKRDGAEL